MKRTERAPKRPTQRHRACKTIAPMPSRDDVEVGKKTARLAADAKALALEFARVRARTEQLAAPLSAEDQLLQSMPDASPTKWHRAHTTWFFETFVLVPNGVAEVDPRYGFLFNSYYEAIGTRQPRDRRGMMSRPTMNEVRDYRKIVDARVMDLLHSADDALLARLTPIMRLGLAHEEQHQELLLTDILHAFSESPMRPSYRLPTPFLARPSSEDPIAFIDLPGGVHEIGARGDEPFVFDNELPRHKEYLEPFAIADRLVTIREMKAFIQGGGYKTASLWLSDGWKMVQQHGLEAPLYASLVDDTYSVFELHGIREARNDEPVLHLSFYEADAIAQFLGARLPTEAEWEVAAVHAASSMDNGNFVDAGEFKACRAPVAPAGGEKTIRQMFGDAWEWTRSSYAPYPGYVVGEGAIGEYNGKFMANQYVLRGGSYLTPKRHIRPTYRNFWPPDTRFQATGVRLARNISV